MKRRWVGAVLVVALLLLAGCHGELRYRADPSASVEGPVRGSDDGYRVTLGARAETSDDDATFLNVSVHGYAADGTELCTADLGNVSAAGTLEFDYLLPGGEKVYEERVVECAAPPSIVAVSVGAIDPSPANRSDGVRMRSPRLVYLGQADNGTHVYEEMARSVSAETDPVLTAHPDRNVTAYAKCRQYASDYDLSTLAGDHPWTEGDPEPPSTEKRYVLQVESVDWYDPGEYPTYDRSDLPAPVLDAIEEARRKGSGDDSDVIELERRIDRGTYLSIQREFLGRPVESLDDLPRDGDFSDDANRSVEEHDGRRLDCDSRTYVGSDAHETEYEFSMDGAVWEVRVIHELAWTGTVDVPTVPDDRAGPEGAAAVTAGAVQSSSDGRLRSSPPVQRNPRAR